MQGGAWGLQPPHPARLSERPRRTTSEPPARQTFPQVRTLSRTLGSPRHPRLLLQHARPKLLMLVNNE